MEAIVAGHRLVRPRNTLLRSISSLLSIGSGGSIGREGAMVHLAAWVGSMCGQVLAPPPASARLLVACAPLMSLLMIFEMTLDYSIVLPLMLACVTAHYVAVGVGGESMYARSLRRMSQDTERMPEDALS